MHYLDLGREVAAHHIIGCFWGSLLQLGFRACPWLHAFACEPPCMLVFRNISKFFLHEGIQSPSLSIFLLLFFYYMNASRHLPTNIDKNSGVHQERIVVCTPLHHLFYLITSLWYERCSAASCLAAFFLVVYTTQE
jgi:hypothetical protein